MHDPDFDYADLNQGPQFSFCPHTGRRAVERCTGKLYCLTCGDDIPPEQLAAERQAAAARQPYHPALELPC
jgi:hypothetical protein